jgi:hypothetical protein
MIIYVGNFLLHILEVLVELVVETTGWKETGKIAHDPEEEINNNPGRKKHQPDQQHLALLTRIRSKRNYAEANKGIEDQGNSYHLSKCKHDNSFNPSRIASDPESNNHDQYENKYGSKQVSHNNFGFPRSVWMDSSISVTFLSAFWRAGCVDLNRFARLASKAKRRRS